MVQGLAEHKTKKRWRQHEIDFIYLVYNFESIDIIVECLNRSRVSIVSKAKQLGLSQFKKKVGKIPISYFNMLQYEAARRGINFNLTIEHLSDLFKKQKGLCAYSGRKIAFTYNKKLTSASLDRKDSNKGYEVGNVQWVHKSINMMKQKMSHNQFLNNVRLIYKNNENQGKNIKRASKNTNQSISA